MAATFCLLAAEDCVVNAIFDSSNKNVRTNTAFHLLARSIIGMIGFVKLGHWGFMDLIGLEVEF